jgi:hypothetical protein
VRSLSRVDRRRFLLTSLAGAVAAPVARVVAPVAAGGIVRKDSDPADPQNGLREQFQTELFVDRHFRVRLTTYWLGIIPIRQVVFKSPDEGPRGGERLVWSRDGRYVLLLGRHLVATDDACLASGEALYLLVDTRTKAIASNAEQTRHRRFSLQELASMDFDMSTSSGSGPATAPPVRGSSAMPQIGHDPGVSRTICGCIGQVHSVRGPDAKTGSSAMPHFGQFPGPRWRTSGCIGRVYVRSSAVMPLPSRWLRARASCPHTSDAGTSGYRILPA